ALKAAILIQRWYRLTMARIEMRRRCALSIFQSVEYADEQAQLQLSSFFTFLLDHFTRPDAGKVKVKVIRRFYSHFFTSPQRTNSDLTEYENSIDVPDSYYGPRLKFPLTPADANAILDAFKNEEAISLVLPHFFSQTLHARYVLQLFHETRKVLKEMPNITQLSTSYTKEITVCGDLHGKLDDLLLIFYKNGLPSEKNPYVFNGDFVDRGEHSIEILIILFAFLLIYPNDLHLNRGNHEDYMMNLRYGFTKEVLRKYKVHGKIILHLLRDVFSWLPLATIVDSKVLILHGGISDTTDLDFLNLFERNRVRDHIYVELLLLSLKNLAVQMLRCLQHPKLQPAFCSQSSPALVCYLQTLDILWSDPRSQRGCTPNKCRGGGCYFGPDITAKVFERYNLKLLIRSHECKQDGYEVGHGGKVVTIFSASNYYEDGSNRGAYIKLNPDLSPRFIQYQVSKKTCRQNLQERVSTVESSALKSLREVIYAHRTELTEAFMKKDPTGAGRLPITDWAEAMESVLHLQLPWRTLRSQLAQTSPDGRIKYMTCFYDLKVEKPVKEVQPALVETVCRYRKDLEIIFNFIDKDHSGLISLEEFRQTWRLFCVHMGIKIDNESINKLAHSIDYNKDGNIDFNEFLEAFHMVHRLEN
ncbi:Serine/threonine-protein phosphatase with EF-hands 1, partial [Struthio camelus australis]